MHNGETGSSGNRLRRHCAQPNFTFPPLAALTLLLLFLTACESPEETFQLKGQFKNFSQGELYIYSLTGKGRIDTVRLADGKFSYETFLDDTLVLSVVFPNFSEIPVVATPGASVRMEGNASHLKEVTVKGTDDNKQLTKFRLQISSATPPEVKKSAAAFIREHPESPASLYLLNKHFLLSANADYQEAGKLLTAMAQAAPRNKLVQRLRRQVESLKTVSEGRRLPQFTAVTTKGARVGPSDLQAPVNIISTWSSWNYESLKHQRLLKQLKKDYGSRLQLLSICLDANREECTRQLLRDTISWYNVCDGKMWESPLVETLAVNSVPDNIVTDSNGKIIARGLSYDNLEKKIKEKMK